MDLDSLAIILSKTCATDTQTARQQSATIFSMRIVVFLERLKYFAIQLLHVSASSLCGLEGLLLLLAFLQMGQNLFILMAPV